MDSAHQPAIAPQPHQAYVQRPCWCSSGSAIRIGVFTLDAHDRFQHDRFQVVQCCGCGVYALFPQPDDNTLQRYYSSEYYGSSRKKFIWPFAMVIDLLQGHRARMTSRLLQPGARLLDVGCGNGSFLMQMKRRGFIAEGTEWSSASAARVPAESGVTVHVGDLLDLDLPAHSYDMVTIWHVLEHVRSPDETLRKIGRLLKPGGRVMIAVPNVESPQARRFGLHWLHHDPPRHLFNFGTQSLTTLLRHCGYSIESISTRSVEQNTFGYIQSWLNARGYPRDRLYSHLKGIRRESLREVIIDVMWMIALTGPALVTSSLQAVRGEGATLIVQAQSNAAD